MKLSRLIPLSLLLLTSIQTFAAEEMTWRCLLGGDQRTVSVIYQYPESVVPCEVVYEKADAERTTLWNAMNQIGYCESKAKAFVERQRGWGWECNKE